VPPLVSGVSVGGFSRDRLQRQAAFGLSRKTGDESHDRDKDCGAHGLTDRNRRPYRHANQLPLVVAFQSVRGARESVVDASGGGSV